eukprot:TRINITY_DN120603_c0_g1_i1.p2 TRINITY_DN120603_c0_g1~~TRINITY_DN120603_c0_g1_i1.p2  ORF type:complete len:408 (-),score=33.89 TRINITY_DN120603_c0_g1_i1:48-1271(-)
MEEKKPTMHYRFLGNTGIKVSIIGFGCATVRKDVPPETEETLLKILAKLWDAGVNFYDTAESYGNGAAEAMMGRCIKKLGWPRKDFVITVKIMSCGTGPNDAFLSRKHIIEGALASLKRLQLDYADIVYAHRYDKDTPMEEICRAFNWLISKKKAFYWGTSEWTPEQIMEAFEVCERLGLIKPSVEQPDYSLLYRKNMEVDLVPMFDKYGLATTTFSPLAGGLLTGKYNEGKRLETARYGSWGSLADAFWVRYLGAKPEETLAKLRKLAELAKTLGCTQTQLALAWVLVNKDVSVAITGATKVAQVEDSLKALEVMEKWTPEIEMKIEQIIQNMPEQPLSWRRWSPFPPRRIMRMDDLLAKACKCPFSTDLRAPDNTGVWGVFKDYKEMIEGKKEVKLAQLTINVMH